MRPSIFLVALIVTVLPATVPAQRESLRQCATSTSNREYCNSIVQAMLLTQPRVGLAAAGGNPVPGASSTLGMRLGTMPRISLGGRVTAVKLEMPALDAAAPGEEISDRLPALQVDASIGVFSGFSLFPTVGGFGSLDLVGTFGRVPLPEGDFRSNVTDWGVGARVGILRESFTAPGISITAMYRGFSDIEYGDRSAVGGSDAYFELTGNRMMSVRAVAGKRLFFIGAVAGIGYDKMTSEASFGTNSVVPLPFGFRDEEFETSRTTLFASAQWTLLILTLVGEAGWQSGGDTFTAPLPAGQRSMTQQKPFFGSIALRLSI